MMEELRATLWAAASCLMLCLPLTGMWFYYTPPVRGQGLAWRRYKVCAKIILVAYVCMIGWLIVSPFQHVVQPEVPCYAKP